MIRRTLPLVAALAVALSVVVGCSSDDDGGDGRAMVVATTPILGDIVESATGGLVDVEVLMPRGADPHDYEPSAREIAMLSEADLVVANGLGLEARVQDALDAAASDGVPVLEVAPGLDPLPFGDHADADHSDDEQDHGELDPHVWQDPSRMARAVPTIVDALVEAVPEVDVEELQSAADSYRAELEALDAEVEDVLAVVPDERRLLVTNHDSLGYFADRYGFEVVGVIVPGGSTLAEPSSSELADLAAEIEDRDVPAIFVDNTVSPALAEALAAEVGRDVEVVELVTGTLGPEDSESGTYVGMVRTNADRIAAALGS